MPSEDWMNNPDSGVVFRADARDTADTSTCMRQQKQKTGQGASPIRSHGISHVLCGGRGYQARAQGKHAIRAKKSQVPLAQIGEQTCLRGTRQCPTSWPRGDVSKKTSNYCGHTSPERPGRCERKWGAHFHELILFPSLSARRAQRARDPSARAKRCDAPERSASAAMARAGNACAAMAVDASRIAKRIRVHNFVALVKAQTKLESK